MKLFGVKVLVRAIAVFVSIFVLKIVVERFINSTVPREQIVYAGLALIGVPLIFIGIYSLSNIFKDRG
jgi:hypothetical protein